MKSELYFPKDETKVSVAPLMRREVVVPADNEVQAQLRRALELLGPNGERWCRGVLAWYGPTYCIEGALMRAANLSTHVGIERTPAGLALVAAWTDRPARAFLFELNDDRRTKFHAVKTLFLRAIELAA